MAWANIDFGFQGFHERRTFAQRFTATGQRAGSEFPLGPISEVGGPVSIIPLNLGGFIIIYNTENARGQRYSASGSPVGGPFTVLASLMASSAARLSNGGFVVVYNTSTGAIEGQRFGNGGSRIGSAFPVTPGVPGSPQVAALTDGGFVVVWTGQDNSGDGIYGRRFNASAAPVGGIFRINPFTTGNQGSPDVAGLANGGFIVTWESFGQDGSMDGVYAQRFSASGARLGGGFRVNSYTMGFQAGPSVTGLTDGGFVIAWESEDQDGAGFGVYGKRYNLAGAPASKEFRVNTFTPGHQISPSLAGFTNGGFVALWTSSDEDGVSPPRQDGIFGQRFMPDAD